MATKTTRKATIIDTPFVETQEPSFDFNAMMGSMPSGTRILCAWIASAVVSAGIGYVGMQLIAYLMIGAMVLTGSAFLASTVYVLGMLLVILASFFAGIGAHLEVISEKIDARYSEAKNYINSFFNFKKVCAS